MTHNKSTVRDAKAESVVLGKRLRETNADLQRVNKFKSLATRRDLEEKVNDLKYTLVLLELEVQNLIPSRTPTFLSLFFFFVISFGDPCNESLFSMEQCFFKLFP